MIGLGLRLTLSGGREAAARLAVITSAVALGVFLLLNTVASVNATNTQNARYAWLNSGVQQAGAQNSDTQNSSTQNSGTSQPQGGGTAAAAPSDPMWWLASPDNFDGTTIGRVDLAATGPHSPVPPGIPALPGPGEYYASPALGALLRSTPADELADRFPGRQIGTIGPSALPGPDSLIVVIGHTPDQLSHVPGARRITSIMATSPSDCGDCSIGTNSNGMALILSVVATALIFPVLILIGTATRLAAARREQRFAAMRLIGATPRQISVIAAVESTVAAVAGVAVGFGLFFLLRPLVATIRFTDAPFFGSDLSLTATDVPAVALGVPVAAAIAARIALRRVRISPLGVTRRATPRPPRIRRVIPLLAGVLELTYFIGRHPKTTNGQIAAFIPGMLLIMAGLVIAGPWLTMVGARLMARRTGHPSLLVAGRRLSDDPRAGFRAVSGLILALCVTTGTVGIITSLVAERGIPKSSPSVSSALVADYFRVTRSGELTSTEPALPQTLLTALHGVTGVQGVLEIHTNPLGTEDPTAFGVPQRDAARFLAGLVSCAQLATEPVFGGCEPGARAASVTPTLDTIGLAYGPPWPSTWPAAGISADRLAGLPITGLVVTTDGSRSAIERARTLIATAYPTEQPPATIAEQRSWQHRAIAGYQQLADVVIMISFPIAGCSLAVSVAAGLSERKRPFSLLRLSGVPLGVLRRVVLLESAVPLLVVSAVAIGMGFLAAQLFLRAQFGYSVRAPGGEYYVIVLAGIVLSLGVIASTLPLLRRITGPETARNE
ncbi:FtsX-like permease family protein [Streptacidiphilus sp. EB129]|uniref:ABC transporter permease n=1 Tax=Streptacidiphilus sp. EB129 TaxID=3156262 RepID=UPI00351781B0